MSKRNIIIAEPDPETISSVSSNDTVEQKRKKEKRIIKREWAF